MKKRFRAPARLLPAGAAAALVFLFWFSGKVNLGRLDLSGVAITSLRPVTRELLSGLDDAVHVRYYVTKRQKMPTRLRGLERQLTALLKEMRRASGGRFSYEVLDPEGDEALVRQAAQARVAPFSVKTITHDEYSARLIYSGLAVARLGKQRSIPFVTDEHLPHLENRIATHIRSLSKPRRIVVGVSAPPGHSRLDEIVASAGAETVRFGFPHASVPQDADLLVLVQPSGFSAERLEEIGEFLADGKDVFMAFSSYAVADGPEGPRAEPVSADPAALLKGMGVEVGRSVLMQGQSEKDAPYRMIINPRCINLQGFRRPRAGKMLFPESAPILLDARRMNAAGYRYKVIATTSEDSWTAALGKAPRLLGARELRPPPRKEALMHNVAVMIESEEAWRGRLFLFSSGSAFSDASLAANRFNVTMFQNVVETFGGESAILSIKASRAPVRRVAETGLAAKLAWRFFAVLLVPLGFAVAALRRLPLGSLLLRARAARPGKSLAVGAGGVAVFLIACGLGGPRWAGLDLTRGRVNSPTPEAERFVRSVERDVKITYVTSPPEEMPLGGKALIARVREKLRAFRRISRRRITFRVDYVSGSPDEAASRRLDALGVRPFRLRVIREDSYVEKNVYSALVFEAGGKGELVPAVEPRDLDRVEFILTAALRRLLDGKRPRLALLADQPRLSPAEAFQEYMEQKLPVPKSADAYSELKRLFFSHGYALEEVSTKTTAPIEADLIVYVQPFLVSDHLKKEINRHLLAGGGVIVAVQHFNIQSRQYRGRDFDIVYWPQPAFSRIQELLDDYGIELKREVLLDHSREEMDLDTQLRWGAYKKELKIRPVAEAFLIRAVAPNFAADSPVTAQLSDQLFIWGNRFVRTGKFPEELSWRALISTSERAWSYEWKGGWIPQEVLKDGEYFEEKQALAVVVEGLFPALHGDERAEGREGKLLLTGCSEMFKNEHLLSHRYEHSKFILNAAARMAYGTELAWIQAKGGSCLRGFGYVSPRAKLFYRFFAVLLAPLVLSAYGMARYWRSRRKSAAPAPKALEER